MTIYGPNHPLSYSAGGTPEGIRNLKPEDIKRFHAANYHLANMGLIASLPKEMTLDGVLARVDAILSRVQPKLPNKKPKTKADLPAAKTAQPGSIAFVEYGHRNEQQPGLVLLAWPATLKLADPERLLLELFLDNLASDPTTNLYKKFVDTKTRTSDLGAKGVFNFVSADMGHPVFIGLAGRASIEHDGPEDR